ncbi:putative selenium delivery protein YdfZ [Affinibrenneria salicis]|uniref:Putative selenium delivery protein YdfZ n=1 Tax=Affinibrenneria salicis TaxID=2590031 RepID=A0A5J5G5B1_9GAMM|nr:putative selenium delivery protein YdfZ [Affinibrenneria salicis]KAA9002065.1 putative selenium delivery protein YdfZ [Affinibrenneria salicis]
MTTYDRYRNPIVPGIRVMDSETGLTGTIAAIHADNLDANAARRVKCIELRGVKGLFKPETLMGLGTPRQLAS